MSNDNRDTATVNKIINAINGIRTFKRVLNETPNVTPQQALAIAEKYITPVIVDIATDPIVAKSSKDSLDFLLEFMNELREGAKVTS